MSLSPQQVIDTADGLVGLASILADPKAYQVKLDELKQYATEGRVAYDKADTARIEAKKALEASISLADEAQQTADSYDKLTQEFTKYKVEQDNILALRQEQLYSRELEIGKREVEVKDSLNQLNSSKNDLQVKTKDVAQVKSDLETELSKARQEREKYEGLTAKLKATLA